MFHTSILVTDLRRTREFYNALPGCEERGVGNTSIDFTLYGHHLIVHLATGEVDQADEDAVRVASRFRHFGVVLSWEQFESAAERLVASMASINATGGTLLVPQHVRYRGEPREETLMFLLDPAGNGVEYKAFRDLRWLFFNPPQE